MAAEERLHGLQDRSPTFLILEDEMPPNMVVSVSVALGFLLQAGVTVGMSSLAAGHALCLYQFS